MRRRGLRLPYVTIHSPYFPPPHEGDACKQLLAIERLGVALQMVVATVIEYDRNRRMIVSVVLAQDKGERHPSYLDYEGWKASMEDEEETKPVYEPQLM